MFKYDDIISTLTLVNTLAKDLDYGYVEQETTKNKDCESNEFYNSQVYNFASLVISKIHNLNFVKFKGFCKNIFFKIKKDFIIFLQKLVLYCKQLWQEYW